MTQGGRCSNWEDGTLDTDLNWSVHTNGYHRLVLSGDLFFAYRGPANSVVQYNLNAYTRELSILSPNEHYNQQKNQS